MTTGRTGSELLVQLLDSHPAVRFESEILSTCYPGWTRLFLRGRAVDARLRGARVHGFKLTADQLWWPVLIRQPSLLFADLHAAGVLLIRLRRQDVLRQAISHCRARTLHSWHNGDPDAAPDLDPADVLRTLVWLEQQERYLDSSLDGLPVEELTYERDLATPEQQRATARSLFDALGLPDHEPSSNLYRSAPRNTSEMVANFADVRAALRHTRFASLAEPAEAAGSGRPVGRAV